MTGQKHILIVDDDRALRQMLAAALEAGGAFSVTEAGSVAEAAATALSRVQRFDAILLDLALPDGDGCELCSRLRRNGVRMPILMLTAAADEDDVVRGLDAGANDYMVKPFRFAELTARLRAQIRAHETSEDAVLVVGPYHFRPGSRSLYDPADNRRIRLTDKEAAVLKFLYRCAGKPVGRQVLLREVWGYNSGASTHTVETHIYRLRRKIERDPAIARILVNEEGGYRLAHDRRPGVILSARPRAGLELAASP
ncbi:response regulator transcription factor [Limobrevibacterium gyesilva]|uniref:Response regulator transcription factor n=1 Tax=Limobrevibacterium gyesilva TaxID=2991712 RepID=A0AA41YMM3_9PROT|nr:response regulator transcription factor [Limobrevibacterium gyesilva]